jgi:hypothetical protein
MIETYKNFDDGFLIIYNAMIGSGKTTTVVGLAKLVEYYRETFEEHSELELLFVCNLDSVRKQVGNILYNTLLLEDEECGIRFGIATTEPDKSIKFTNHYSCKKNSDRTVTICGPETAVKLLEESEHDKYLLFHDEPTIGADIQQSLSLRQNVKVLMNLPKWTIFSSATAPNVEDLGGILTKAQEENPNIIVKKGLRKLKKFEFEIWSNPSDSLLLRVNFYKVDGELGKPKTNLNTSKKNIYKTIYSTDIVVTVDLEPYEIYVKDNFIASLELLEIYGEQDLGLVLAASLPHHKVAKSPPIIGGTSLRTNGKGSYRRYASQDNWKLISDVNMAYHIESDLMVSEKVAQRYERKMAKRKKNRQKVSGFAILNGKMISDVTVLNSRTKETTKTNENGKYIIEAKEKDILMFSKKGFHVVSNKVRDKPTLNALMKPLRK